MCPLSMADGQEGRGGDQPAGVQGGSDGGVGLAGGVPLGGSVGASTPAGEKGRGPSLVLSLVRERQRCCSCASDVGLCGLLFL